MVSATLTGPSQRRCRPHGILPYRHHPLAHTGRQSIPRAEGRMGDSHRHYLRAGMSARAVETGDTDASPVVVPSAVW